MIRVPRRYWHEPRGLAVWLACVAIIVWRILAAGNASTAPENLREGVHRVRRVVDGDTLLLQSCARVRLQGVDAPETVRQDWPVEPWGQDASAFTKNFVADAGQRVRLTFDLERLDRHGRFLAFVWHGDIMLNEELVRVGLARARTDYRFSIPMKRRLVAAEREARAANRGIWSSRDRL